MEKKRKKEIKKKKEKRNEKKTNKATKDVDQVILSLKENTLLLNSKKRVK